MKDAIDTEAILNISHPTINKENLNRTDEIWTFAKGFFDEQWEWFYSPSLVITGLMGSDFYTYSNFLYDRSSLYFKNIQSQLQG